eukprot:1383379-Lingulodinium_polyedra.AAC.1
MSWPNSQGPETVCEATVPKSSGASSSTTAAVAFAGQPAAVFAVAPAAAPAGQPARSRPPAAV